MATQFYTFLVWDLTVDGTTLGHSTPHHMAEWLIHQLPAPHAHWPSEHSGMAIMLYVALNYLQSLCRETKGAGGTEPLLYFTYFMGFIHTIYHVWFCYKGER
uniref:Uncharacterized protein n=1 Tax=Eutreptiella gymnastica TaxID=73025 RepID=A0A7S4G714_9EUGL